MTVRSSIRWRVSSAIEGSSPWLNAPGLVPSRVARVAEAFHGAAKGPECDLGCRGEMTAERSVASFQPLHGKRGKHDSHHTMLKAISTGRVMSRSSSI